MYIGKDSPSGSWYEASNIAAGKFLSSRPTVMQAGIGKNPEEAVKALKNTIHIQDFELLFFQESYDLSLGAKVGSLFKAAEMSRPARWRVPPAVDNNYELSHVESDGRIQKDLYTFESFLISSKFSNSEKLFLAFGTPETSTVWSLEELNKLPDNEEKIIVKRLTAKDEPKSSPKEETAAPTGEGKPSNKRISKSRKSKRQDLEDAFGKIHVLSVGINNYDSFSNFSPLKTCTHDATEIRNVFQDVAELNSNVNTLTLITSETKEKPSRGTIMSKLIQLSNCAQKEERILFYFSGHGTTLKGAGGDKLFLVPEDAYDPEDEKALIDFEEVKKILNKSLAKHKLIFLDACSSGPDTSKFKGPLAGVSNKFLTKYIRESEGIAVLSACGNSQKAITHSPSEASLFTHYLLEALSGSAEAALEDYFLTFSSLAGYVSKEVQRSATSQHHLQQPCSEITQKNTIILGDFRPSQSSIANTLNLKAATLNRITFEWKKNLSLKDILTEIKNYTYGQKYLEEKANDSLGPYLRDDFGEISANLSAELGFLPKELGAGTNVFKFPGGICRVSYHALDKKKGYLQYSLSIATGVISEAGKILKITEAFGVNSRRLVLRISKKIEPMDLVAELKRLGWTIDSQLTDQIVISKEQIELKLFADKIGAENIAPEELLDPSKANLKVKAISEILDLVERKGKDEPEK